MINSQKIYHWDFLDYKNYDPETGTGIKFSSAKTNKALTLSCQTKNSQVTNCKSSPRANEFLTYAKRNRVITSKKIGSIIGSILLIIACIIWYRCQYKPYVYKSDYTYSSKILIHIQFALSIMINNLAFWVFYLMQEILLITKCDTNPLHMSWMSEARLSKIEHLLKKIRSQESVLGETTNTDTDFASDIIFKGFDRLKFLDTTCAISNILFRYFMCAQYSWVLVETITIHWHTFKVFKKLPIILFSLIGWLLPLPFIGISTWLTFRQKYYLKIQDKFSNCQMRRYKKELVPVNKNCVPLVSQMKCFNFDASYVLDDPRHLNESRIFDNIKKIYLIPAHGFLLLNAILLFQVFRKIHQLKSSQPQVKLKSEDRGKTRVNSITNRRITELNQRPTDFSLRSISEQGKIINESTAKRSSNFSVYLRPSETETTHFNNDNNNNQNRIRANTSQNLVEKTLAKYLKTEEITDNLKLNQERLINNFSSFLNRLDELRELALDLSIFSIILGIPVVLYPTYSKESESCGSTYFMFLLATGLEYYKGIFVAIFFCFRNKLTRRDLARKLTRYYRRNSDLWLANAVFYSTAFFLYFYSDNLIRKEIFHRKKKEYMDGLNQIDGDNSSSIVRPDRLTDQSKSSSSTSNKNSRNKFIVKPVNNNSSRILQKSPPKRLIVKNRLELSPLIAKNSQSTISTRRLSCPTQIRRHSQIFSPHPPSNSIGEMDSLECMESRSSITYHENASSNSGTRPNSSLQRSRRSKSHNNNNNPITSKNSFRHSISSTNHDSRSLMTRLKNMERKSQMSGLTIQTELTLNDSNMISRSPKSMIPSVTNLSTLQSNHKLQNDIIFEIPSNSQNQSSKSKSSNENFEQSPASENFKESFTSKGSSAFNFNRYKSWSSSRRAELIGTIKKMREKYGQKNERISKQIAKNKGEFCHDIMDWFKNIWVNSKVDKYSEFLWLKVMMGYFYVYAFLKSLNPIENMIRETEI